MWAKIRRSPVGDPPNGGRPFSVSKIKISLKKSADFLREIFCIVTTCRLVSYGAILRSVYCINCESRGLLYGDNIIQILP